MNYTILLPSKPYVEHETENRADIIIEGLHPGYGVTLGNALRRVLFSSLAGSAVTRVKIDSANHEFSTIPGVKEDVTDMVLNIKNLRFKLHADRPKTVRLRKKGPGEARAKDIIHDADVEVLNPDLHIATLDKEANLDIEMTIRIGSGYVPAERNKEEGMAIGVIPVDSIFTPVKKVNVTVENARVGRITDYDKLIMEIWTDGGVKPEDALAYAAKILKDHLAIFINFDETIEPVQEQIEDKKAEFNKHLLRSVHELELSVRAANCLKNANIKTIGDLVQRTEYEMLRTKNFGRKSLNEIKEILTEMGLSLGLKVDSHSPGDSSGKEE